MLDRQVDNWPVREHAFHRFLEYGPFIAAVETVTKQKAATQQVGPELLGLAVGQIPGADEARDHEWPEEDINAIIEIDRLLDSAHVDS